MNESWKTKPIEVVDRNYLAGEIKRLRAEIAKAKKENKRRFPTEEEEANFEEIYRQFPFEALYKSFQQKKIEGISVSEETEKRNSGVIRRRLREYYQKRLNTLFPFIESRESGITGYLERRFSEIENLETRIELFLSKLKQYNPSAEFLEYYILMLRELQYRISDSDLYETLILPDSPTGKAEISFDLTPEDDIAAHHLLQRYKYEIYKLLLDLPSTHIFLHPENIEKIVEQESVSQMRVVANILADFYIYAKDEASLDKFQKLLESSPTLFDLDESYREAIAVDTLLFGSIEQSERVKTQLLEISQDEKKQDTFLNFIQKLILRVFKIESQYFDFRDKLIDLLASLMDCDTSTASTYLYKWTQSKARVNSVYNDNRVGLELKKYLELKKAKPGLILELREKLNLFCLGRYPTELLERMVLNYEDKDNPYFLTVVATRDHNGAFANQTGLQMVQNSLGKDGNVLAMEAGSYFEVFKFLKQRSQSGFKPPSIIYINAHGSEVGFLLAEKTHGRVTNNQIQTTEKRRFTVFLNFLKANRITLVLGACETGKGQDSIAQLTRDTGVVCIAPEDFVINKTNFDLIVKDGEIHLNKVTYTLGESITASYEVPKYQNN